MNRKYFKQRFKEQEAAVDRIKVLFDLAKQEFNKHPERSSHYASLIISTAKKMKVRIPSRIKRFICMECNSLLVPGKNLIVRSIDGFMVYQCLKCGNKKKYGYLKEKKLKG